MITQRDSLRGESSSGEGCVILDVAKMTGSCITLVRPKYSLDNIILPKPRKKRKKRSVSVIPPIMGLDTEANTDAELKMVCTSEGHIFTPQFWLEGLLDLSNRCKHYFCYNLGYDEGHFIRFLPKECREQLWLTNKTKYKGLNIESIPRKVLHFSDGKRSIWIWDTAQYYHSSLKKQQKNI